MLHLHFLIISAIPKVVIDPPRPGKLPPNHHNRIPDMDQKRTTTTKHPPVTQKRIFPVIPKSTPSATTTTTTTTTRAPLPPKRVTPPPRKPAVPTWKPFIPTKKPSVPTHKPYVPPRPVAPTRLPPTPPPLTPVDNTIQKEVTKQRGDVHSKSFLFFLHSWHYLIHLLWLICYQTEIQSNISIYFVSCFWSRTLSFWYTSSCGKYLSLKLLNAPLCSPFWH